MLPSRIDKNALWKGHAEKFRCDHPQSELRERTVTIPRQSRGFRLLAPQRGLIAIVQDWLRERRKPENPGHC
jgi:hypothetical protein